MTTPTDRPETGHEGYLIDPRPRAQPGVDPDPVWHAERIALELDRRLALRGMDLKSAIRGMIRAGVISPGAALLSQIDQLKDKDTS